MAASAHRSADQSVTHVALLCGLALTLYLAGVGLAWSRTTLRDREANAEPLRALASPLVSAVFTVTYWAREANQRTPLWAQACAFCAAHPDATNCAPVVAAQTATQLREVAP